MAWGQVTVGGFALREEIAAAQSGSVVTLAGQESHPPSTRAFVTATHHNIAGLLGRVVPVTFTDKDDLSGFFRVTDCRSDALNFSGGMVTAATWSLTMERLGSSSDIEIESRVPTVGRTDELTGVQVPSFWHAPAVGHTSYFTGSSVPGGTAVRESSDGNVTVYTGIPAGFAPRWTAPIEAHMAGSVRLLFDTMRHLGTTTPPMTVWELNNGIVRVTVDNTGTITTSVWDSGAWRSAKGWKVQVAGASLTTSPELTVLRNDPEEVTVRLTFPVAPGRVQLDLGLRRGARFVTAVLKRHAAANLGIIRTAAETATVQTGGLLASSVDSDGNRFAVISSRTITTTTATASATDVATLAFDFALGYEVGATPGAGNTFAELLLQYLGTTGERAMAVRR